MVLIYPLLSQTASLSAGRVDVRSGRRNKCIHIVAGAAAAVAVVVTVTVTIAIRTSQYE